jgi:hypothetical protein
MNHRISLVCYSCRYGDCNCWAPLSELFDHSFYGFSLNSPVSIVLDKLWKVGHFDELCCGRLYRAAEKCEQLRQLAGLKMMLRYFSADGCWSLVPDDAKNRANWATARGTEYLCLSILNNHSTWSSCSLASNGLNIELHDQHHRESDDVGCSERATKSTDGHCNDVILRRFYGRFHKQRVNALKSYCRVYGADARAREEAQHLVKCQPNCTVPTSKAGLRQWCSENGKQKKSKKHKKKKRKNKRKNRPERQDRHYDDDEKVDEDVEPVQEEEKEECCICFDGPPSLRFVPCGHAVVCSSCDVSLPSRICVICRSPIESTTLLMVVSDVTKGDVSDDDDDDEDDLLERLIQMRMSK